MKNGLNTRERYPSRRGGIEGPCKFTRSGIGTYIKEYRKIPTSSESQLQEVLATVGNITALLFFFFFLNCYVLTIAGPVSVSFDASRLNFQFYGSGVYYEEENCSPNGLLTHAGVAVGYDTDERRGEYYIIRNSWGESWGINGYMHLARNKLNHCGIASAAYYPLVYTDEELKV